MSNWIAGGRAAGPAKPTDADQDAWSLYARDGTRKYLNRAEWSRVLVAVEMLPPHKKLFVLTLAWTGARVSEVLALTPSSFQLELGLIAFRTLKRRRHHMREVPTVPPQVMMLLECYFDLSRRARDPQTAGERLWPWHPATAWRMVKQVMGLAHVTGRQACPRGLRHAFGVGTQQARIPLNVTQVWMGHARMSTTAIYTSVCGPEEFAFARQFWLGTEEAGEPGYDRTRCQK